MEPPRNRITFRADAHLIESARGRARREGTTLNDLARQWLENYARRTRPAQETQAVLEELSAFADTSGQKFTRDEMNERR